ncbi:MAG: hypothetical protein OXC13_00750 [Caldilineaceae bacterium]|nr:hypothetical protein [Caldilineaceae bacterium]
MPDLTIRIREDGSVSVAKIPLSWIPGMDQVSLDSDIVARFTDANVQHIHLDYHDAGMAVLVNGMLILDFRYDDHDQLRTLLTALTIFMGDKGQTLSNAAKTLLPVLEFVGAELVFEFPVPSHRPVIPKADEDSHEILDSSNIADGDARAQVRGIETISLSTTAMGKVTSGNFIFKVLRAALPPDVEIKLPPTTVAGIREKGITEITVKTRRYGLAIELNGQPSPQLICNLDNLLAFAEHRDRWRRLAPSVSEQRFELVRRMVQDVLQTHNVDIRLHFPVPIRPDSR